MDISPAEIIDRSVLGTKDKIRFNNFWSRLFLKRPFLKQLGIPPSPPRLLEALLQFCEGHFLKIDFERIPIKKPIFLIGLHRSGTTMLQDILCAHPNMGFINNSMPSFPNCFCASEFYRKRLRLGVSGERFLGDSLEVNTKSPNEGMPFWRDWLKEDLHSLEYHPGRIEDYSQEEIQNIYDTIKKILWCFEGKATRFFSKNPRVLPYLDLLKDLFPDAKFIHIIRDARSCANSMVKLYHLDQRQLEYIRANGGHDLFPKGPYVAYPRMPKLTQYAEAYGLDSIETTARLWNDAIDLVNEAKDRLPTFHEVRYEDILAHPREEILKILSFCELSEVPSGHRPFWEGVQQVGSIRHSNRYGDYDLVERICRDNLQKYDYL